MHGTNVAEITTRVAPTAETIIREICGRRDNLDGMVERLAEVSFPLASNSGKI